MNVRTLCLAILNYEDATGYEIRKHCFEGAFRHFAEVSYGSIYPALAKLEQDGLVTYKAEVQDGKPDRKMYSITDSGKKEFVRCLNVLPQPDKFKSEFLLLAINADIASAELLDMAISAQITYYEEEMAMITAILEECDQPALLWTAKFGEATIAAKLAYLKSNREQLLAMAQNSATALAAE